MNNTEMICLHEGIYPLEKKLRDLREKASKSLIVCMFEACRAATNLSLAKTKFNPNVSGDLILIFGTDPEESVWTN